MKKNTIKAFTLVEMLIVIVIIGILIAALLPRMQAAQGRARDVARKTALSQVQSAIVTYQGDNGKWPWSSELQSNPSTSINLSAISGSLINAGMTEVPTDPLENNVKGLGGYETTSGNYAYMVSTRNGADRGGFILMASTEVAGGSNRVVCEGAQPNGSTPSSGAIGSGTDLATIKPCSTVAKGDVCSNENKGETCYYSKESELRYIVLY